MYLSEFKNKKLIKILIRFFVIITSLNILDIMSRNSSVAPKVKPGQLSIQLHEEEIQLLLSALPTPADVEKGWSSDQIYSFYQRQVQFYNAYRANQEGDLF